MEKKENYERTLRQLDAVLKGIHNEIAVMATLCCILKQNFSNYYWAGFYRVVDRALMVGPYQGTLGCLKIEFGKGVCGTCASEKRTIIARDVEAFPGHIACDFNSKSEIVVPVFDKRERLIAVFDVDSTELASFDQVDQTYLETIMNRFLAI